MAKPIDKKNQQQKNSSSRPGVPAVRPGAVTNAHGGALPASLMKRASADAGKGVSTAQEDNLVPIAVVLQDLSPQTKKRDPKYMEGAEPGMIWLKNCSSPLVSGDEGIPFQPCYFDKDFVEWVPRDNGGGFVARHRTMPSAAKATKNPKNPKKTIYVMPNGNEIVETRYHIGRFFLPDGSRVPYVIPLASSGHSVSKEWMFKMNNVKIPGTEDKAASFAKLWLLKTRTRSNVQGTWFVLDPQDIGWVQSEEDYEAGLALFNAFEKSEKDIDTSQMSDARRAAGDDRGGDDM